MYIYIYIFNICPSLIEKYHNNMYKKTKNVHQSVSSSVGGHSLSLQCVDTDRYFDSSWCDRANTQTRLQWTGK